MAGVLYLVSTPIGNLADITLRALETLRSVDVIAAEDTRHSRKLLSYYDIHKPLVSYHSHNAVERGAELIGRLKAGENIAVVTDAGAPGISDPGTLLAQDALAQDLSVTFIPGASAPIMALSMSGLSTHPFVFLGFPPSRGAGRTRFFSTYAAFAMTLILFESPRRLQKTLDAMLRHWGDRKIAVAREMTKLHEEVFRGTISETKLHFSEGVRGECTLVVEGFTAPPTVEEETGEEGRTAGSACIRDRTCDDWRQDLRRLLSDLGFTVKDATEKISTHYGLSRRIVYREALEVKKRADDL